MRRAEIYQQGSFAGILEEVGRDHYRFTYSPGYSGEPVSLTLPVRETAYQFSRFPPVFEGLLPEGLMLQALLRQHKIDRADLFKQLVVVGQDVVGSLTIKEAK